MKTEEEVKEYVLDRYAALKGAIIDEEQEGRNIGGLNSQRFELFRFAVWFGIADSIK